MTQVGLPSVALLPEADSEAARRSPWQATEPGPGKPCGTCWKSYQRSGDTHEHLGEPQSWKK